MVKEKITVLKGIVVQFLDGTNHMVHCKSYGLGGVGLSCFSTRSPSMDLAGNHIRTFIFSNIIGFEVIWGDG